MMTRQPDQEELQGQLEIWREVARHIDLDRSLPRLFGLLHAHVPLEGLRVDHVLTESSTMHTVAAVGSARHIDGESGMNAECHGETRLVHGRTAAQEMEHGGMVSLVGVLHSELGYHGLAVFTLAEEPDPSSRILIEDILPALATALENQMRLDELTRLRQSAEADRATLLQRLGRTAVQDHIVGQNGGLATVMKRVNLVAASTSSVLLLGATGSGKEVIARAVHERSDRAQAPFIRVNCGAIAPELIDSELFGHEKGSFTGAVASRRGWFERADGGTLFLDEVAELPFAAQVRLLRVLQEGTLTRLGSEREIRVDVRVVAATHRDLAAMVAGNRFREDLWYRIAVFPIRIPGVSERPEDIPALAEHLARRAANRLGLPLVLPNADDIQRLRNYHWPGNVREMASVFERAAILGDGHFLDLDTALGSCSVSPSLGTKPAQAETQQGQGVMVEPLNQAIAMHIRRALKTTEGRIDGPSGAAKILDINPNTLRSRLRKLGIDPQTYRNR